MVIIGIIIMMCSCVWWHVVIVPMYCIIDILLLLWYLMWRAVKIIINDGLLVYYCDCSKLWCGRYWDVMMADSVWLLLLLNSLVDTPVLLLCGNCGNC